MPVIPRPGILEVSPYVGGESAATGRNRAIRLASNENPLGPSPQASAAYAALRDELHRYPDGAARALRAAIAEAHGLDAGRIVCGAGSDELIALLVRAYAGPGDEVLHSAHGFLMYAIAAKTAGATPVAAPETDLTADVEAMLARVSARTRLVFLANPNNPTGSYLDGKALRRLRLGLPEQALLVIDAAYAEYVTEEDYESGAALVDEFDNVVMTRTFSKIYGLAALRLGWATGPAAVIDVLNRVRGPFNVSQAALTAGVAALTDGAHVDRSRRHNARWRAWFAAQMTDLGLHAYPSVGNFLLVRFPDDAAHGALAALSALKETGILVRDMTAYGLPACLRITIGDEADMRDTAAALAQFMATGVVRIGA
jgi:histidinol-phosphate aminotransferase